MARSITMSLVISLTSWVSPKAFRWDMTASSSRRPSLAIAAVWKGAIAMINSTIYEPDALVLQLPLLWRLALELNGPVLQVLFSVRSPAMTWPAITKPALRPLYNVFNLYAVPSTLTMPYQLTASLPAPNATCLTTEKPSVRLTTTNKYDHVVFPSTHHSIPQCVAHNNTLSNRDRAVAQNGRQQRSVINEHRIASTLMKWSKNVWVWLILIWPTHRHTSLVVPDLSHSPGHVVEHVGQSQAPGFGTRSLQGEASLGPRDYRQTYLQWRKLSDNFTDQINDFSIRNKASKVFLDWSVKVMCCGQGRIIYLFGPFVTMSNAHSQGSLGWASCILSWR